MPTSQQIRDSADALRHKISKEGAADHTKLHSEILDLIVALAERVSELEPSDPPRFVMSPDGETVDV